MRSYLAIIINRSKVSGSTRYQECTLLISAESETEAKDKAAAYANDTVPVSYENQFKETVTWDVYRIQSVMATLDPVNQADNGIVELGVRSFDDIEAYEKVFSRFLNKALDQ